MTQSNTPTGPGNVVPFNQPPWLRPPASPPGCFSQLYGLNQCYDDIIMMKQILSKVICDMAATDPAFQACLVNAIAASGSNVPLIGVTNGSNAQPGQVGEYVQNVQSLSIAGGAVTTVVQSLLLQPGDWDVWAWCFPSTFMSILQFSLSPLPTGFSNDMVGNFFAGGTPPEGILVLSPQARASVSVPTLMVFSLVTSAASAFTCTFQTEARRAR